MKDNATSLDKAKMLLETSWARLSTLFSIARRVFDLNEFTFTLLKIEKAARRKLSAGREYLGRLPRSIIKSC
jgi:hypothetical protein